MAQTRILLGDILAFCRHYHGPKFHAVLCDPPYHLTSIVDRFGKPGAAAAKFGRDGAFQRAGAGFMNLTWDGGDIAFRRETWAAIAAHVYPGGFIGAFGGSRGYHRMAVAMEDAGLILHPSIGMWVFGSGFPKATRIDIQIDHDAGVERDDSLPATDMAKRWAGYRYGLQALKPAAEMFLVAQVPYSGRPVDSITQTGAGAYNIDGSRIGVDEVNTNHYAGDMTSFHDSNSGNPYESSVHSGRWPANFILGHTPECRRVGAEPGAGFVRNQTNGARPFNNNGQDTGYTSESVDESVEVWDCPPHCPVRKFGEQSGKLTSGQPGVRRYISEGGIYGGGNGLELAPDGRVETGVGDSGTAARYFLQADWNLEVSAGLIEADPVRYVAKASRSEREAGLVGRLPCRKCGNVYSHYHFELRDQPEGEEEESDEEVSGYKVVKAGTKGALKIKCRRCGHPTVKPIALTTYLARLFLPPQEYTPRRILIPFAGVGSEMVGAALAGWEEVVGVEMTPEYVKVARPRLAHYCGAIQLALL